jgi:hypothetical protein
MAAPLLRSQIDIVQDRGVYCHSRITQSIDRELDKLAFGASPPDDQHDAIRGGTQTDCFGKAENRGQVYNHYGELLLEPINEIEKSLDVLARPSGWHRGAWHEIDP